MQEEKILGFTLIFEKKKDRPKGSWYARRGHAGKCRIYVGSDKSKAEEKILAWLASHPEVKEELEGKGIEMEKCKICVHWKNEECDLPGYGECQFKAAKTDQVSSQPDLVETQPDLEESEHVQEPTDEDGVFDNDFDEPYAEMPPVSCCPHTVPAQTDQSESKFVKQSGHGMVEIASIKVGDRMRSLKQDEVARLAESIKQIDLLNPIVVDADMNLIAGYHRLEACKLLGWKKINATVLSIKGLERDLAEIDENLIRNELSALERSEHLGRRKEIYEKLHPETMATKEGGGFRGNQYEKVVSAESALTITPSFVEDTMEKTGQSKRTLHEDLQIAKSITPAVKDFVKQTPELADKKTALLEIAKASPEKQMEIAKELAEGKTVKEVKAKTKPDKPDPGMAEKSKAIKAVLPGMEKEIDFVVNCIEDMESRYGTDPEPESKQALQAQLDQAKAELSRVRTTAAKTLEARQTLQAELDQAKAELIQSLAEISKVKAELANSKSGYAEPGYVKELEAENLRLTKENEKLSAELANVKTVQPTMFEPQPATDVEILSLKDLCKQKDMLIDELKKKIDSAISDMGNRKHLLMFDESGKKYAGLSESESIQKQLADYKSDLFILKFWIKELDQRREDDKLDQNTWIDERVGLLEKIRDLEAKIGKKK